MDRMGLGGLYGDYNNDGFEDLWSPIGADSMLYDNNGDGTFTDVTRQLRLCGMIKTRWYSGAPSSTTT